MRRAPRIPRAQVMALSRLDTMSIPSNEWMIAAVAFTLLLAGLLGL
jgi:hypothetical protein